MDIRCRPFSPLKCSRSKPFSQRSCALNDGAATPLDLPGVVAPGFHFGFCRPFGLSWPSLFLVWPCLASSLAIFGCHLRICLVWVLGFRSLWSVFVSALGLLSVMVPCGFDRHLAPPCLVLTSVASIGHSFTSGGWFFLVCDAASSAAVALLSLSVEGWRSLQAWP